MSDGDALADLGTEVEQVAREGRTERLYKKPLFRHDYGGANATPVMTLGPYGRDARLVFEVLPIDQANTGAINPTQHIKLFVEDLNHPQVDTGPQWPAGADRYAPTVWFPESKSGETEQRPDGTYLLPKGQQIRFQVIRSTNEARSIGFKVAVYAEKS